MSSPTTAVPTGVSIWQIDPSHSTVNFSVRHMMVANVRGEFSKVAGTVAIDARDLARSSAEVTIDVGSITTRDGQRDAHLLSPDFLDAAKYPTIQFRSTRLARKAESQLAVSGDLTIRGVTRPVVLDVEMEDLELKDPFGNIKRGASATTKISRKDFGLEWNVALETGGFLVGEEVKITLDVELLKQA